MVSAASPASARSKVEKPAVLTVGPSRYTASELTPKETASRVPVTRERRRSSTYWTMSASMKGMAPKTKTITPITSRYNGQPVAFAASRKSGIWAADTGSQMRLSGKRSSSLPTTSWASEAMV